MIAPRAAAYGRDEGNLVIILEGCFAVNVFLIAREGHRASEFRERGPFAADYRPELADRGFGGSLAPELRGPGPLAQHREESNAYLHDE